jgi:hypothetical protein
VGGVENQAEPIAGGQTAARDDAVVTLAEGGLDEAALLARLSAIESRPLERRAAALADLHDELRARLEGGDAAAARG